MPEEKKQKSKKHQKKYREAKIIDKIIVDNRAT